MADGGVFTAVRGVEEAVKEGKGGGTVAAGDGVGELVKGALFGREDHGFYVAKSNCRGGEHWR